MSKSEGDQSLIRPLTSYDFLITRITQRGTRARGGFDTRSTRWCTDAKLWTNELKYRTNEITRLSQVSTLIIFFSLSCIDLFILQNNYL